MALAGAFKHRLATEADLPALKALMDLAISELQKGFLTQDEIEASRATMGLDTQLIADRTYFIIEDAQTGELAGCGGWSRRATLYGGNHTKATRDDRLLDPATEAARIRAMYTHPDHVRRGVGRLILRLAEEAARAEGFKRAEMGATLAGMPLYRACGYEVVEEGFAAPVNGIEVPVNRMGKPLAPAAP